MTKVNSSQSYVPTENTNVLNVMQATANTNLGKHVGNEQDAIDQTIESLVGLQLNDSLAPRTSETKGVTGRDNEMIRLISKRRHILKK